MMNNQVTMKHFLMLKYWHKKAPNYRKIYWSLPHPGDSIDGFLERPFDELDIYLIEDCYKALRDQTLI